LLLSRISLTLAVVLVPLRFRWLLRENPVPPVYVEYTNQYLFPTDILLLLTLGFWLFRLLVASKPISFKPQGFTLALGGLVVISMISSYFSIDPQLSIYHSLRMLVLFGLYLYLINETPSFALLAAGAGIQLVTQSMIGIAQVLRQHSLGLTGLKELPLDPAVNGISIVWTDGLRSLRAYGLTDHPNILGGCLAFSLILLVVLYLEAAPAWRPWLGVIGFIGTLGLFVTYSRSAWLGLAAGGLCLIAWLALKREWKTFLNLAKLAGLLGLGLLPFILGYAPLLSSRMNGNGSFQRATPENQAIGERSLLASQALIAIERHPWIGSGAGTFPEALLHEAPQYPFAFQPPHLVLLEVAAETGLPGAALYGFILLAPWILLVLNYRQLQFSLPLAGISAALLAIEVVSLLDYYPWLLNPGRLWQWLLWGAWAAFYQSSKSRKAL
jgi:O-antigen ligase